MMCERKRKEVLAREFAQLICFEAGFRKQKLEDEINRTWYMYQHRAVNVLSILDDYED